MVLEVNADHDLLDGLDILSTLNNLRSNCKIFDNHRLFDDFKMLDSLEIFDSLDRLGYYDVFDNFNGFLLLVLSIYLIVLLSVIFEDSDMLNSFKVFNQLFFSNKLTNY